MKVIYTIALQKQLVNLFPKVSLFLALLVFSSYSSLAQCDVDYIQIGSYHVEFVGVEYDYPQVGQSTWFYTFYATSGKDISHVTIPLSKSCIDVLDSGKWGDDFTDLYSGQGKPNVGKDPKAKIPFGMKFDEGIDKGDAENYYFTLDKNLAVEPVAKISIKAGRPFYKGTVCGPSEACNEYVAEPAESCISGQTFHDLNVNGIRDAGEQPIAGVVIKLRTATGIAGQVTTGVDGKYSFCGLQPDAYVIQMQASFEYLVTQANIGSDDFDSDLVGAFGTDFMTINTIGESFENVDGGYFKFVDYDNQAFLVKHEKEFKITKSTDKGTTILIDPTAPQPNVNPSIFGNSELNTSPPDVKVTIYPNPFMEKVTFKKWSAEPIELKFKVMTQSNQFITSGTIASNEKEKSINLDYIPNGIYYVHFYTADGVTVQKIIKRK